jgi:uncharacterized protein
MSQMPTYPGVYIHELPSATRTITGVSTSITAFIGSAKKGPTDEATTIHSWSEYERIFGGLYKQSNMSYGVYHYFLNGGTDAVIVRVVNKDAKKSTFVSADIPSFWFESANPGSFTKDLFIYSDNDTKDKMDPHPELFNLHIEDKSNGRSGETFLNLSFNDDNSRFITTVLKEESNLVNVKEGSTIPNSRPKETRFDLSSVGEDGNDLDHDDIIGDSTKKTGMHALDNVDLFNMLCIPPYKRVDIQSNEFHVSAEVYNDALQYCHDRRAILVVDPPYKWKNKDDPKNPEYGIDGTGNLLPSSRDSNAAIFFPRIRCPDPLQEGRIRSFAPSGAIAGVIARTDSQRGFWKAPAGIEASLMGVSDLEVRLTDAENGELYPLGINCLRIMPAAGRVVWGSRTMKGADRLADQWKYLPVRRTALYIEESLYRGTQWVVFEPNDDRLWGQIRLNVGTFMHDLFRKGAFQGSSPRQAYLVKCDHETTTQSDIDQGIVNILVGFAPVKPAEFVMLNIQQLAGQQEVE